MKIHSKFVPFNPAGGAPSFTIEADRVFRGMVIGYVFATIEVDMNADDGYPVFIVGSNTERTEETGGVQFDDLDLEAAILKVEELTNISGIEKLHGFMEFYNAAFFDAEEAARK